MLMCWGQRLLPVVVLSAEHVMMADIDVQGLGQALGSPLEEARKTHPRALVETNARHKVSSRKEMITARMRRTIIAVGTSSLTRARSGSARPCWSFRPSRGCNILSVSRCRRPSSATAIILTRRVSALPVIISASTRASTPTRRRTASPIISASTRATIPTRRRAALSVISASTRATIPTRRTALPVISTYIWSTIPFDMSSNTLICVSRDQRSTQLTLIITVITLSKLSLARMNMSLYWSTASTIISFFDLVP